MHTKALATHNLIFGQPVKLINILEVEESCVSGIQLCEGPPQYKVLKQVTFESQNGDVQQSVKPKWTNYELRDGELIVGIRGILEKETNHRSSRLIVKGFSFMTWNPTEGDKEEIISPLSGIALSKNV